MSWSNALSEHLRASRAVAVLHRSLESNRLGHALLLQGEDPRDLTEVAEALAAELLGLFAPPEQDTGLDLFGEAPPPAPTLSTLAEIAVAVARHPDYFELRPAGKARIIGVDPVRELLREISQTPNRAERKVAVLHDADRLNKAAQNILLKTLEEPPADTHLLLLTTRPYALLDTIRSRTLYFRLPASSVAQQDPEWAAWLEDYAAWMKMLRPGAPRGEALARAVLGVYSLAIRFQSLLDDRAEAAFKSLREQLPAGQSSEALDAAEVGLARELRRGFLRDVEKRTRDVAAAVGASPRALIHAVQDLEEVTGLLEANLREEAALEHFLLRSLRHWST